jgi:hypothetical protein
VGVALTRRQPINSQFAITTAFPGLLPLTPPLNVTRSDALSSINLYRLLILNRSEGNLVISLANANPAQLLLNALRNEGYQANAIMDSDIYLGVMDSHDQVHCPLLMECCS